MDHMVEPAPTWFSYLTKPVSAMRAAVMLVPWVISTRISVTLPRVVAFMQAIRKSPPPFATSDLKVAAAGFCWGGKHAILLAHDKEEWKVTGNANPKSLQSLVDCVFVAHPSFIDVPNDIKAIQLPTSISVGDQDNQLSTAHITDIRGIFENTGVNEIKVEEGAKHGFSVRLHPGNEHEAACAARAEQQALDWFRKYLHT